MLDIQALKKNGKTGIVCEEKGKAVIWKSEYDSSLETFNWRKMMKRGTMGKRRKRRSKKKDIRTLLGLLVAAVLYMAVRWYTMPDVAASMDEIPPYDGIPYVVIDDNHPAFAEEDKTTTSYETYGLQDLLGRCGVVEACIGQDLMPTEKRGDISSVKPTGWEQGYYDFVDGGVLYNRCHLIGFQLTGENDNERNLITGTRYLNVEGMLPFENEVADYIEETGNHVLYRVTPVFEKMDLVARGVRMEALSVEDDGAGVCFDVYCYNVQPGVEIDYGTGENWLSEELAA